LSKAVALLSFSSRPSKSLGQPRATWAAGHVALLSFTWPAVQVTRKAEPTWAAGPNGIAQFHMAGSPSN